MAEYDITTLYREHADRLKRYVRLHVQSPEEVEDIVQNVFLELCKPGALAKVNQDVHAYILGTARHLVAQHLRQSHRPHLIPWDECLEPSSPPAPSNSVANDVERIYTLLRRLPPKAREALKLRYLDGLPSKEAAALAGCSEQTFYVRLHRALQGLRSLVHADGEGRALRAIASPDLPSEQNDSNRT